MSPDNRLAQVRCFLLDMDGTFYLGERVVEGALYFINVLREQGRQFLFVTNNSSKDRQAYAAKLARLGLALPIEAILTSGEATAMHLRSLYPGSRVFVVGTPALEAVFQAHDFVLTAESPDFAVVGFDTTLTYAKLWQLCNLVRAGVTYVATHPDYNCPTELGYMPDIGATIAYVRAATGREPDMIIGKPNRLFAEMAARHVGVPLASICMIGDRLYTDIALGETAGILTVLVLSGESRVEDLSGSPYKPDYVFYHLGAVADYLKAADQSHMQEQR